MIFFYSPYELGLDMVFLYTYYVVNDNCESPKTGMVPDNDAMRCDAIRRADLSQSGSHHDSSSSLKGVSL